MFVGVSGQIGAGKSTLTDALAHEMSKRSGVDINPPLWRPVFEPADDNPYLEDFYQDIKRWSFAMHMYLMGQRFRQHQGILWDHYHRGVIQDRMIYDVMLFVRMLHDNELMTDREWETFSHHYAMMTSLLRPPDVVLYLHVTPETALERINQRAREGEVGKISLDYLRDLHLRYEAFADEMGNLCRVIKLDWNEPLPTSAVADILEGSL